MGLKLKYQITTFLIILFSMATLVLGYFNISILDDQINRFSSYQAKTISGEVLNLLEDIVPQNCSSIKEILNNREKLGEFSKSINQNDSIYNVKIYDENGGFLFSKRINDEFSLDDSPYIKTASKSRIPQSVIWAIDKSNGQGTVVMKHSLFESRMILNDFYYPVVRDGKLLGLLQVSVANDKSSRIIFFLLFGNLSLIIVFIVTAFIATHLWAEHAINKPIRNLVQAHERLKKGDFDAHVYLSSSSSMELGQIASSFNNMARELKGYQEELKDQARKLEKLNEEYKKLNETLENEVEKKTMELREFFSLITHDLKIPLAAIKGYTSLLQKEKIGALNEKQAKFVSAIEISSNHLLSMIKNMLDSVKYEAGKVEYFFEEFDLKRLVEEVFEQVEPSIAEKEIKFDIDIPDGSKMVYGDRSKIAQVVGNILSNAINYTSQGGEISVTAGETIGAIEVKISDTGSGIPPEQLPLIFEKFQQVPGRETPSTSLGLGLYIVRKIMEGHNMKVWAQSVEGEGSTFYFTIKKSEYVRRSDKKQ